MATVNSLITLTPDDSVKILDKSNIISSVTGASETNLAQYTLPAGTMGANDTLRITVKYTRNAAGTANTQSIVRFGGATVSAGTVIFNNTMPTTALTGQHQLNIDANNSTSAQKFFVVSEEEAHRESTGAMPTGAIDTTADVIIWFNGVATNGADTQNLESYTIELIRGS